MTRRKRRRRHSASGRREGIRRRWPSADLQGALDKADRLILRGRAQAAVELLEPFLESHPREAEVHYYLGYAHAEAGDTWQALSSYERAQELSSDPSYWLPLASLYVEVDLRVHALRAFRQAVRHQDEFPLVGDVPGLVAALEEAVAGLARDLDLPVSRVEPGLYHMERGRRALAENNFRSCISASRQAVKLLGDWPPPHNNLSLALFWSGQLEAAIAAVHRVLSYAPDNVHALSNGIRYLAWTGRVDEARELWPRLKSITPSNDDARRKIVEAAAILDEDETVYELLRPLAPQQAEPSAHLIPRESLFLAIAEANIGRRRDAQRRLETLRDDWPWAGELLRDLNAGRPGSGWSERFPYFASTDLLSAEQMDEFVELVRRQDDVPARRFRRDVDRFVTRFPQVVRVAEKLILEEGHPEAGIAILATIGTPEAYDVLRRFGLSQFGEDEMRLEALTRLTEAGEIGEDDALRVWLDGEWREVYLRTHQAPEEEEDGYLPEVADLLNQGVDVQKMGDHEQAERLFRRALELEPRAKQAYNNLGAIYARRGEHDQARAMFENALAIDPLYSIPRCNLASYLLDDGDVEGAEAMLKPLMDAPPVHPQDITFYLYTQSRLLLAREEYVAARRTLRNALEVSPDYKPARDLLERLDVSIPLMDGFRAMMERQRQRDRAKRARMQTKVAAPNPSLSEALSVYTKDGLTGMARIVLPWGGWSTLRKAELLQEIIKALSDPGILGSVVGELDDTQRAALRQVLAGGGTMAWADFDALYGNDMDESPYWQWHVPETTMGQLRLRGLLAEATADGELLVTIPSELRSPLRKILE